MQTSAFAMVRHAIGISLVELGTPPAHADEMARYISEEHDNAEVHNLDQHGWVVRACFTGDRAWIFIDAPRAIDGRKFAELIGQTVSEITGEQVPVIEMPTKESKIH